MQHTTPRPDKDPQLWEIAENRASFKYHLGIYVAINLFSWAIWLFTDGGQDDGWPWPVWPMLGWGIGVLFHYLDAYVDTENNAVEKEYEKLKREQNK